MLILLLLYCISHLLLSSFLTYLLTCITGLALVASGQVMGIDWVHTLQHISASPVAPVFKFAVATPFAYHYLGAIRHAVSRLYIINIINYIIIFITHLLLLYFQHQNLL